MLNGAIDLTDCQCTWDDNCWVKGRGTVRAIRGCRASFDIHLCDANQLIDLTVEIKGPENTICFERIGFGQLRGSNFKGRPFQLGGPKGNSNGGDCESTLIPMWYLIVPGKVSIYYIPLVIGIHRIRLFNKSAQIRGSPFTVYVEQDFYSLTGNPGNLTRSATFDPSNCDSSTSTSSSSSTAPATMTNKGATTSTMTMTIPTVIQERPKIIGTMDKYDNDRFPLTADQHVRKSKSSELISSVNSTIESIWERPSVSGIENLKYSSESTKASDSDSSADEEEEDCNSDDDDDVISFTSPGCTKCWLPDYDFVTMKDSQSSMRNDLLTLADRENWIKEMDKRYKEKHFKEHSFRVKSLIEYWNKMSSSNVNCPCSEENHNQCNHQQYNIDNNCSN